MTTFFSKIPAKCTHFEVSSLGLELQVSSLGLGVFDEALVSSRNFNQVSVSVSKVTVSTTSLMFTFFCITETSSSAHFSSICSWAVSTSSSILTQFLNSSSLCPTSSGRKKMITWVDSSVLEHQQFCIVTTATLAQAPLIMRMASNKLMRFATYWATSPVSRVWSRISEPKDQFVCIMNRKWMY